MPFSNRPFSYWDKFNWIKVFPLFRTILDSWKISSKSVWSREISLFTHKQNLLRYFVPRVPSFYIWTKSRCKNPVTTVYLLQCKTNFFIHLCLWGRNLSKLKNIYLGKPHLISFFFDSFTLDYIRLVTRLHWSTSV